MIEKLTLCGPLQIRQGRHGARMVVVDGKCLANELEEAFNPTKLGLLEDEAEKFDDYGYVQIAVERIQREPADRPADFLESLDRKLAYKKPLKGDPGW